MRNENTDTSAGPNQAEAMESLMRRGAAIVLLLLVQACAYPTYVNDEYRHIPLTSFAHENRQFRIFDKPSASKLVITPSLTTAMSDVVIRNVTLDRYNNSTERMALDRAVSAYLASQGRKCVVTGSAMMYDPQWEFTYSCESLITATP